MSSMSVPATTAPTTPQATTSLRRIYNPVQKDAATFVQTAKESGGVQTILDLEVAPGGGNMLHFHKTFAERFTVITGQFGVQVGERQFTIQPGETAVAPAMALHRWYNTSSEAAVVRVELLPGNIGFEQSLQITYGLARDGLVNNQGLPKNIAHLAILLELSDTGVPGAFSAIAPLMRVIARYARRKGVERALIARYCF